LDFSFFAIPQDATFWDILNSPILVALIAAAIGWQLNNRVKQAEEKAEDATNAIELEAASHVEEAMAPPNEQGGPDLRANAAAVYKEAEDFLTKKGDSDTDGRRRRTYKNLRGAGLRVRAGALLERRQITDAQYAAAEALFNLWNQYRRGRVANRVVSADVLANMRAHLDQLKSL
jgi:hypothetical protein